MPINLTDAQMGGPLEEGINYVWRITSVSAVESKAGNLRLNVMASVVEGPSAGQTAAFPGYEFMLNDRNGPDGPLRFNKTMNLMTKILGVERSEIKDIPSGPGDVSDSMALLLNAHFEAPAMWQPPEGEYAGRWFVGRVIRAA
jgi:hypothetical protein